jgi:hypothetical protein
MSEEAGCGFHLDEVEEKGETRGLRGLLNGEQLRVEPSGPV